MKTTIVVPTINQLNFLDSYIENFRKYEVSVEDVTFLVLAGESIPAGVEKYVEKIHDYHIEYWNPEDRKLWIKKTFPGREKTIIDHIIPNNDSRCRNFGFLRSYELGSDNTIIIDDDNFPLPNSNWLEEHIDALYTPFPILRAISPNNIVNPCRLLDMNHFHIYSRGYPVSEFFSDDLIIEGSSGREEVVLNMGLWNIKPDVDAFTNIIHPDLHSFEKKIQFHALRAEDNTYFPINTQNTSFKKKLSIFHNLYMDPTVVHRYDDIWMGLFAQKLTHRMGDTTSFGSPIVDHKRNSHNFTKDLSIEFLGIGLNSQMWKEVMNMDIYSHSYEDGFLEIATKLPTVLKVQYLEINKFLGKMIYAMEFWIDLLGELN